MKEILLLFVIYSTFSAAYSQNVGVGTNSPNPSAALDITSNNKGVLVPRIALTAVNVESPVSSPADALLVYNTATAGNGPNAVSPGFYYWNAAAGRWTTITSTTASNSVGFGTWGDCSSNISEYHPVADDSAAANDNFGYSVSLSGNYAIVGAFLDDVGANVDEGSASIYHFDGHNWILMQKLTDATGLAGDNFGISVSISGNYAIVGALSDDVGANNDQGSAHLYQYNGTNWVLMQKLTNAGGLANDNFGISVSIWNNYAIVGAYADDVGGNGNQGTASIYEYNGSSWILMQQLTDASGAVDDFFGTSVSIWNNYAIVGAYRDDVDLNGNQGSASIYKYNGSTWALMQKLTDPNGGANDNFGISVSISGNHAIVGTSQDDVGINMEQGSASIFTRIGNIWQKLQYTIDPGGAANERFGNAVSTDGTTQRFVVGARNAGGKGKAVFGKIN